MIRTVVALSALAMLLSACGRLQPLEPQPGLPLPVKPMMAKATPDAEKLLTPPTYARPERVDELMKRSQPRDRDRFDLPPPAGGAVPLPAPGSDDSEEEAEGPVTP